MPGLFTSGNGGLGNAIMSFNQISNTNGPVATGTLTTDPSPVAQPTDLGGNTYDDIVNNIIPINTPFSQQFGSPFSPTFTDRVSGLFGGNAGRGALGFGGGLATSSPAFTAPTFSGPDQIGTPNANGSTGALSQVGGEWAALDIHNSEIGNAASRLGVPANLLKALINNESSGDWNRDGSRVVWLSERQDYILPFVGITKRAADSWGLNWNQMVGNKQAQIDGMATILKGLANQYGGFENAIKVYFGGEAALNGEWADENGLGSGYYYNKALNNWRMLDQKGGGDANTQYGSGIVDIARQYLGVKYVWGSLPGADQDPWQTGWDCSAFVNWLDDKYGSNEVPAGSHYQYQAAKDSGKLFTDQSQLQAGDVVYLDTGWGGGAGAELNNAGHVGIYVGNGQIINALNPSAGTVISDLNSLGTFVGAQHMSWSSGIPGGGGSFGGGWDPSKPEWFNILKYGRRAA